jgi:hypothetical protein
MKLRSICATKNNEKSAILVMTVGVMIIVAMLALALIMLSTSQMFIVQTQRKELQGFYAAEVQILWAAYKLQSDPSYEGGSKDDGIADSTYDLDSLEDEKLKLKAEEIIIKAELTGGPLIDLDQWASNPDLQKGSNTFNVSTYIEFSGAFGKKKSAVRLDAVVEREVEEYFAGKFKITARVKEWSRITPPTKP